jgi:hypothetical protein
MFGRCGSISLFALLAVAEAGCSIPATTTRPPYTVDLNQRGRSAASDANYAQVKVNVFENVGKRSVWIEDRIDVPCTVYSTYYSKDILAPAVVNVPTFGDQTPNLNVRCTLNGQTVEREGGVFVLGNGSIEYADQSLIFGRK